MAGESEANFPESPSFAATPLTPPPVWQKEEQSVEEYADKVSKFLTSQYNDIADMQSSISSGWLIDTVRVLNLTADTILANEIFTEELILGGTGSGNITLSGATTQIVVYDEAGTERVEIGDFGSTNTNWGIRISDENGDVVFQSTSATFIDGAIIQNATIVDSQIVDLDGDKLQDSTVVPGKMNVPTLSAITADVGTLTAGEIQVSSSKIGLVIDGAGGVLISNGGDIRFTSTASGDNNFILFYDSTPTLQAGIVYDATSVQFKIVTVGTGTDILIDANDTMTLTGSNIKLAGKPAGIDRIQLDAGDVELGASSSDDITFLGRVSGNILPKTNGSGNIGDGSNKFALVRATTITSGDLKFENGWILTEPNMVHKGADPNRGLCIMNHKWIQVGSIDEYGNLEVAGKITENVKFKKPTVKRTVIKH